MAIALNAKVRAEQTSMPMDRKWWETLRDERIGKRRLDASIERVHPGFTAGARLPLREGAGAGGRADADRAPRVSQRRGDARAKQALVVGRAGLHLCRRSAGDAVRR